MQLFYNQDINPETESLIFDREESRHIIKVLRKQAGDILLVTNGSGFIFTTEIVSPSENKCTVKIIDAHFHPRRPYHLHLAVAPTKMNERYEWFLEKATEIGIDEITPLICEHSERKTIKSERFEKIIQSAMKQSAQAWLPILNQPVLFSDFVLTDSPAMKLIAHCAESEKSGLRTVAKKGDSITMLIGPEGDFSAHEIALAIKHGYKSVTLGNTRLRTETAAIVACHSLAFINQD